MRFFQNNANEHTPDLVVQVLGVEELDECLISSAE